MDGPEVIIPILAIATLFLGLPWLVFHYITKWKQSATLTKGDEKLLDDLYEAARRLDDRVCTIERIMTAENPNWRQSCLPGRGDTTSLLANGE
ncbi:MAG: envelope stress response membrane protein PspB [Sphingomicrobium sp.]